MAMQFATLRPLNIEYTYVSPNNYKSSLFGQKQEGNKRANYNQFQASTNFNFLTRKKWYMGATLGYQYTQYDTHTADGDIKVDKGFHYNQAALNTTVISTLFNKGIVYTGSVIVDGSERSLERIKGLVTASLILKADMKTKLIVGLVYNADASSEIPVIPTFLYEQKLNDGFVIDVLLPSRLMLRKHMLAKGRLSIGTNLDRTSFYLYKINPDDLSQKYEYRQIELNNGLIYEHLLGQHLILRARTGAKWIVMNNLFEKEVKFNVKQFSTSQDPSFFFNLGLSFNPFIKTKK